MTLNKNIRFIRRQKKVRRVIQENEKHPRLSVYRSNKHIYAQIIEDKRGVTLVAANDHLMNGKNKPENPEKTDKKAGETSDKTVTAKNTKIEMAYLVGEELAKKALKKKISEVVFDKGGYRYHGRVKALAEGARKGGMKF